MRTLLIILLAAVVAFFAFRSLRSPQADGAAPRSDDSDVIAALQSAGSDLSKPHPIDFFLYFPSQSSADQVSKTLAAQGDSTSVEASEDSQWLVLANRQLVPTDSALAKIRSDLTALASAQGGEYDGWESMVVR